MALNELESFDSAAQAKSNLRAAIEQVAGKLGNTPTICRKCYVHPEVLNSYLDGKLVLELKERPKANCAATFKASNRKKLPSLRCCAADSQKKPNGRWRRSSTPRQRS
jgi:DNA topoisomerase-1